MRETAVSRWGVCRETARDSARQRKTAQDSARHRQPLARQPRMPNLTWRPVACGRSNGIREGRG
eukprot:2577533-Prymnesium_polylepis.1